MGTLIGLMGSAYLIFVVLAIVLVISWIILPFAILGTKPLLRQLISEVRRNNELLEKGLPMYRLPPAPAPPDV